MNINKGYIFAFCSVLFMVLSTLLSSTVIGEVKDIVASLINVSVVLIIIAIKQLLSKEKFKLRKPNRNIILMGIFSLIGIIFMYESIRLLGASTYAFVSRISVIFSLFIGIVILNEKSNVSYLGIAVTLIGIIIMQFTDVTKDGLLGIITTIIFTFCFSVSNALAKIEVDYTSEEKLLYSNIISLTPLVLFIGLTIDINQMNELNINNLVILIVSAIFSSFIGMKLFYMAIENIDFSTVTIIRTLNPVMVMILSFVIFEHQQIVLHELFGGALIFIGILMVILKKMK